MPAPPSKNVRRAALSCLRAWAKGHDYAQSLINRHCKKNKLGAQDRAFLNSLLLYVLRNRSLLDHWISKLRRGKLDRETRDILRIGLAQILLGTDDHAAVYETVNCARSASRGLVNAVLRRAVTQQKTFLEELENAPPPTKYSHPDWLWKHWKQTLGEKNSIALMQWNNQPAEDWLRLNPLKEIPEDIKKEIKELPPHPEAQGFYKTPKKLPPLWLEKGYIYIQDPSTRHAPQLLKPKPGEQILDACASPGGKAAYLAAIMENTGQILCTDSNQKRLPRLQENLERLGVHNAEIQLHDWTTPPPDQWKGRFNAILLDVPCSNTGVFRRRVDARWRLQPNQLQELPKIQQSILENATQCLALGGRIVYSTCSIEKSENKELLNKVISVLNLTLTEEIQIIPPNNQQDGAYAALLINKK